MRRCPCHHCDGIDALIVMALLPLMCRRHCNHRDNDCRPCHNGVSAIVELAYSSNWRCCPHNNGVVAVIKEQASLLLSSWCRCPHRNVLAVANVASLQSRCLCRHHNNAVALVAMAMLLLSSWCCCPCHNGFVAIIDAHASLLLSRWRCCPQNLSQVGRYNFEKLLLYAYGKPINKLNHFVMSKMDAGSSSRWLSASSMT
jgi:hypothetical protein